MYCIRIQRYSVQELILIFKFETMKYFKKISLSLLLAMVIVGCTDVVDITQKGTLPPEQTFQTVDDLQAGLLSVYSQVDIIEEIYFSGVFTDEISIGRGNGGQGLGLYNWILNPGTGMPSHTWVEGYDTINKVTRLIVAAQNIDSGDEQALYDAILGQAYAIRAFEYFNLLKYFSADITDDASLGVIIFEGVPDLNAELPRSTTGEVFAFINSDMAKAESLIPAALIARTRFTRQAVTALRARIALYRGNWAAAEQFSQQILDQRSLAAPDEYTSMWLTGTVGEMIFKLQRVPGDGYDDQDLAGVSADGWLGNFYAQVDTYTGIHFEVSRSLYNLMDDDDIRRSIISAPERTIVDPAGLTPTEFYNQDINPIYKYAGYEKALLVDQPVFRVSEMLLINAEAKAMQGDLVGAALLIDQLRDARHTQDDPVLPVYASQQEALADILKERRIELAYEGHRYFDLRRIGPKIGAEIDRAAIDCELIGTCSGPVPGGTDSYKYVLPIPLVEFNANNNITQNPGYGSTGGSS